MIDDPNDLGYPGRSWIDAQSSIINVDTGNDAPAATFAAPGVDFFPSIDEPSGFQASPTFGVLGTRPSVISGAVPIDWRPSRPSIHNIPTATSGGVTPTSTTPTSAPASLSPAVALGAVALLYLLLKR